MSENNEAKVRVVYSSECSKLTVRGKGKLGYELGYNALEQQVMRISSNEHGGTCSYEWVLVDNIETLLTNEVATNTTFRSTLFKTVFKSKSVNNSGYLAAILKDLKVIDSVITHPTQLVFLSFRYFKDKMLETTTGKEIDDVEEKKPARKPTRTSRKKTSTKTPSECSETPKTEE